ARWAAADREPAATAAERQPRGAAAERESAGTAAEWVPPGTATAERTRQCSAAAERSPQCSASAEQPAPECARGRACSPAGRQPLTQGGRAERARRQARSEKQRALMTARRGRSNCRAAAPQPGGGPREIA